MSPGEGLEVVAEQAAACTRCDLYARATQTVFGSGPTGARLLLVGEQPGDHEDKEGEPFVGPAGRVLDRALASAGIERSDVYLTNAVKHFKWSPRGVRRIHERPNRTEVVACRKWLDLELQLVDPAVVVTLGAVAGQSLWGSSFKVGPARGRALSVSGHPAVATIHPSSILRDPDLDARRRQMAGFVADLRRADELSSSDGGVGHRPTG